MNLNLRGFEAKVDHNKATVRLEHTYRPLEGEDVEVTCEYLKPGEKEEYAKISQSGEMYFDMKGIFHNKVSKISGLTIDTGNGPDRIETPDVLLAFPAIAEIDAIVRGTAMHLITMDGITKEESKNSESDTNA